MKSLVAISKALIVTIFILVAQTPVIAQTFEWVKHQGGLEDENSRKIVLDDFGNIYTTGYFHGTVDWDPGPGIFNLYPPLSIFDDDIFISKLDALGNFVWAKKIGGNTANYAYSLAVDGSSNIYITGKFQGTVDFDPDTGTFYLTSLGLDDMFITKLDASGNFVWAKQFGGPTNIDATNPTSIVLDGAGNIYSTGFFGGTADFNPGPGTFNLVSDGQGDIFVLKLNSSGNFGWAKKFGGSNNDRGNSMDIDDSGNIYTVGGFRGTSDFDPDSGIYNLTSSGQRDIFISKLNSSGSFEWAKQLGGISDDFGGSVVINNAGNALTTGWFRDTVDFDPGLGTFNLTSAGNYDIFISKLDADGNFIWAKSMGGSEDDIGTAIATDNYDNVYSSGYFAGTADFDPGIANFSLTSTANYNIFISKLDASGNFLWAGSIGGTDNDNLWVSITLDSLNNIYTTSHFNGIADFDPGVTTSFLTAVGQDDIFIHKLNQSSVGIPGNSFGSSIIVYPNPTTGSLTIELEQTYAELNVTVKNILGQDVLYEQFSNTDKIQMKIEVATGIYFAHLTNINGQIAVVKVLKE